MFSINYYILIFYIYVYLFLLLLYFFYSVHDIDSGVIWYQRFTFCISIQFYE